VLVAVTQHRDFSCWIDGEKIRGMLFASPNIDWNEVKFYIRFHLDYQHLKRIDRVVTVELHHGLRLP